MALRIAGGTHRRTGREEAPGRRASPQTKNGSRGPKGPRRGPTRRHKRGAGELGPDLKNGVATPEWPQPQPRRVTPAPETSRTQAALCQSASSRYQGLKEAPAQLKRGGGGGLGQHFMTHGGGDYNWS